MDVVTTTMVAVEEEAMAVVRNMEATRTAVVVEETKIPTRLQLLQRSTMKIGSKNCKCLLPIRAQRLRM